jgi:membrane-associated phospholipid phosphatase
MNRRRMLQLGLGLGSAGLLSTSPRLAAQETYSRSPGFSPRRHSIDVRDALPRVNPVLFWNNVCLELMALDHSIDAADSRAPGPCAAATALALVHIAMADATAAVYPVDYEAFYVRGVRFGPMEFPEAFVGGAAARMLEHIYNTPAHTQLIGMQRLHFLKELGPQAQDAWNAGLSFARAEAFASRWKWREIKHAAVTSSSDYRPRPGEHDVDPFNPDQKFYGVTWGQVEPLVRELRSAAVGPGEPPHERDREFIRDAEEVREIGVFHPGGATDKQVSVGLYWAYDAARLIGPPPRQYNQFVRQIIKHDGMSVPEMARALALCNIAMAEAGVVAWEGKYRYRVWRPVLALPRLLGDRNWRPFGSPRSNPAQFSLGSDTEFRLTALSMLGGGERHFSSKPAQNVLPYEEACFTPNFPSYPSGHATFGSACFNMLKRVRAEREPTQRDGGRLDGVGDFVSDELNGISIDHFRNEPRPYLPIAYRHIDRMIEDNNKSRIYLGVHWDFDCKYGSESGARIADVVYRHAYRRRDGHYR